MQNPHARTAAEVREALGADPERGLSAQEAERRLKEHGPNRVKTRGAKSPWRILADQAKSLVVALLFAAAAASFLVGETLQGAAILVALLLNLGVGFVTEWRASKSMEALRRMERTEARVLRGGERRTIAAAEIVPGDVVLVEAGDMVPADLRLVEASRLRADESSLTGESTPVGKTTEAVDADAPLAERGSMLFKGTAVANGGGRGIAVATGRGTELGEISEMAAGVEEERIPLQRRLDELARRLMVVILVVALVVSLIGIVVGRDLMLMLETGVALVVAAIPEGLPVVASIALARGMWRLARRNALIERLAAVETLGSTNVICSDKTGTLTENRMTLRHIAVADGHVSVADADDPDGEASLTRGGEPISSDESGPLRAALEVMALCESARLGGEGDARGEGDPTEIALLAGAAAAGVRREALVVDFEEVARHEFDPEVKKMATVHRDGDGFRVAVKGAPEAVLEVCDRVLTADGERELDEDDKDAWRRRNAELAADGLRALALAQKRADSEDNEPYEGLTLIGLVGMVDPPRREVRDAIETCRRAGIQVVMITGDQAETARAIAEEVGLVDAGADARVITGKELSKAEEMSDEERRRVLETPIFARIDPAQKLDLIAIHQDAGRRVAMTGDGVNDAPALEKADIGIAMGQRGTQVAREAADMVLEDDSFATIVVAVAQGRAIFRNIRRFVVYMLSGNAGEIFAVALVAVLNAPLPLLPLQILYINIISDVFPALALGVSRGGETLDRPPRPPDEPVLTRAHWYTIGGYGLVIAASVLGVFFYALEIAGMSVDRAVAISFATFALARLLHAFNMREPGTPLREDPVVTNRWLWASLGIGFVLLLAALYAPVVSQALETVDPGLDGWLLIVVGALVPLALGQLAKVSAIRKRIPKRLLSR